MIVLALTACSGGQGSESPQTTTTAPPITRQALATMVPKTVAFPPEVRSLTQRKPSSAFVTRGYVTNSKASEDTPDPSDSGSDLARLGRTGGYRNTVAPYTFVTTLALAEATVHAFRTDEEAQRFLDAELLDLQVGEQDPNFGGKIASVQTFIPPALGPAMGVGYTTVVGNDTFHVALEGFRIGRVVGSSTIARLDKVDPRPLADELAQTLSLQMDRAGA